MIPCSRSRSRASSARASSRGARPSGRIRTSPRRPPRADAMRRRRPCERGDPRRGACAHLRRPGNRGKYLGSTGSGLRTRATTEPKTRGAIRATTDGRATGRDYGLATRGLRFAARVFAPRPRRCEPAAISRARHRPGGDRGERHRMTRKLLALIGAVMLLVTVVTPGIARQRAPAAPAAGPERVASAPRPPSTRRRSRTTSGPTRTGRTASSRCPTSRSRSPAVAAPGDGRGHGRRERRHHRDHRHQRRHRLRQREGRHHRRAGPARRPCDHRRRRAPSSRSRVTSRPGLATRLPPCRSAATDGAAATAFGRRRRNVTVVGGTDYRLHDADRRHRPTGWTGRRPGHRPPACATSMGATVDCRRTGYGADRRRGRG